MPPALILVSGPQGSGKTTFSVKIGKELGIPVFNKDSIKEVLFAHYGHESPNLMTQHNEATYALMEYSAETMLLAGRSLVLECNFRPALVDPILQRLRAKYQFVVVQVYCLATEEQLLARIKSRAGSRHPGHNDETLMQPGKLRELLSTGVYAPLHLTAPDTTISVDTTDWGKVNATDILTMIRHAL